MKLKSAREGMLMLRKDMIQGSKRANYQNKLDRINNALHRPNLSHSSKKYLEEYFKKLQNLMDEIKE